MSKNTCNCCHGAECPSHPQESSGAVASEVSKCGSIHNVTGPGGGFFTCVLPENHSDEQDHNDGNGRKWKDGWRGTVTTRIPKGI